MSPFAVICSECHEEIEDASDTFVRWDPKIHDQATGESFPGYYHERCQPTGFLRELVQNRRRRPNLATFR